MPASVSRTSICCRPAAARPTCASSYRMKRNAGARSSRRRALCQNSLGADVRRKLVFNEADAILEEQLAFLEALNLQQVSARRAFERRNSSIQVAVLLQEPRQLLSQLAFFLFGHHYLWLHVCAALIPAARFGGAGVSNTGQYIPKLCFISSRLGSYCDYHRIFRGATRTRFVLS